MLIIRSLGVFEEFVRSAEQKVGQVISGSDTVRSGEDKSSVGLVGINRIRLENRKPSTKLPVVAAPIPGQRVRKSIGIVSLPVNVWVEAKGEAASKVKVWRAEGIVRLYIYAQSRHCRRVRCRKLRLVPTRSCDVTLVQHAGRKRFRIAHIRKIVPVRCISGEARNVGPRKRIEYRSLVISDGERDAVVLRRIEIELTCVLVWILCSRP